MYNQIIDITNVEVGYVNGPITLAQAKAFCRAENTSASQDALFSIWIIGARTKVEQYCGLSLIPRNIVAVLQAPQGMMELPMGPVTSVPTFVDSQDVAQSITLIGLGYPSIKHAVGYTKASYTAGFDECPELLKQAILMQVCYYWENRGDEQMQGWASGVVSICQKFKRSF